MPIIDTTPLEKAGDAMEGSNATSGNALVIIELKLQPDGNDHDGEDNRRRRCQCNNIPSVRATPTEKGVAGCIVFCSLSSLQAKTKNGLLGQKKKSTATRLRKGETGTEEEKETPLPLLGPSNDRDDGGVKRISKEEPITRDIWAGFFVLTLAMGAIVVLVWPSASELQRQFLLGFVAVGVGIIFLVILAQVIECFTGEWRPLRGERRVREETKTWEESEGRKLYGACDMV
ncbi:uncharacterized protein PG986_000185 [Apiospora aurea]|uniref:Uncharacterized protein n=1 Tax=Apiospora aurea TaxID=335848 RepID=A0ABR1QTA8_9PEZI